MDKIMGQAKAIVGLMGAILTALLVTLPDAAWLKVAIAVVGGISTYLAAYNAPYAPSGNGTYDAQHGV